ncbi:hypothetical protein ACR2XN_29150 [Klebsiella pneumoniae]
MFSYLLPITLIDLRNQFPNVQMYYNALRYRYTGMSVNGLSYGWMILLNESGNVGRQFPYKLLHDLTLTELFHMKNIVIQGGSIKGFLTTTPHSNEVKRRRKRGPGFGEGYSEDG